MLDEGTLWCQIPVSVLTKEAPTATSAVDLETDRNIQEIIRGPQFADVTMLTIAWVNESVYLYDDLGWHPISDSGHRLNTILESDRVLVLDAGRVCPIRHPWMINSK